MSGGARRCRCIVSVTLNALGAVCLSRRLLPVAAPGCVLGGGRGQRCLSRGLQEFRPAGEVETRTVTMLCGEHRSQGCRACGEQRRAASAPRWLGRLPRGTWVWTGVGMPDVSRTGKGEWVWRDCPAAPLLRTEEGAPVTVWPACCGGGSHGWGGGALPRNLRLT